MRATARSSPSRAGSRPARMFDWQIERLVEVEAFGLLGCLGVVADELLQERSSESETPPSVADSIRNVPLPFGRREGADDRHFERSVQQIHRRIEPAARLATCGPRRDRRSRAPARVPPSSIASADWRRRSAGISSRVLEKRVDFAFGERRAHRRRVLRGRIRAAFDDRGQLAVMLSASRCVSSCSAAAAAAIRITPRLRTIESRHMIPSYTGSRLTADGSRIYEPAPAAPAAGGSTGGGFLASGDGFCPPRPCARAAATRSLRCRSRRISRTRNCARCRGVRI